MPRMSLELVVTAIVILVVALVMLTIFGTGMIGVADMSTARSQCANEGGASCRATGQLPPTWAVKTKSVRATGSNDVKLASCQELIGSGCGTTCVSCLFSVPAMP